MRPSSALSVKLPLWPCRQPRTLFCAFDELAAPLCGIEVLLWLVDGDVLLWLPVDGDVLLWAELLWPLEDVVELLDEELGGCCVLLLLWLLLLWAAVS